MDFWDFVGFFFWSYVLISYLMILFAVVGDIFRDPNLSGGLKAVWVILLVFVPFITVVVYLITRGDSMRERQTASMHRLRSQEESYIRSIAANSPADEIAKAKVLFEAGTISQQEFDGLKERAMAGASRPAGVS